MLMPSAATTRTEVCTEHQLPVAACFVCDPALREPGRLWCGEHDRYEDRCFLCHPEIKEADRLWCEELSLYEDECFFCHPELAETESEACADDSCRNPLSTPREERVPQ